VTRGIFYLLLALSLPVGSQAGLFVYGDSTAIGARTGIHRVWNAAPSIDSGRWWQLLGKEMNPPRIVFNHGKGGQGVRELSESILPVSLPDAVVIIYDRRNSGETPQEYLGFLEQAIAILGTSRFLIMPQVPQSESFPEEPHQALAMAEIDRQVAMRWPDNVFSPTERLDFLSRLAPDDTRHDGLHRNDKGHRIEASVIGEWLRTRGW